MFLVSFRSCKKVVRHLNKRPTFSGANTKWFHFHHEAHTVLKAMNYSCSVSTGFNEERQSAGAFICTSYSTSMFSPVFFLLVFFSLIFELIFIERPSQVNTSSGIRGVRVSIQVKLIPYDYGLWTTNYFIIHRSSIYSTVPHVRCCGTSVKDGSW